MQDTNLRQRDHTSTPFHPAPPGACDCHAHIFGPVAEYPYAEGRSYTPPDARRDEYLAMLKTLGIERAVIVQPSVLGFDNRCTTDAVGAFGTHRARSIVMIPPDIPEVELQTLHNGGARGVRFITTSHGGASLDQLQEVAARVAPFGWHIQMYVPAQTWADLAPVIAGLPVPVVMDHMAGITADQVGDDQAESAGPAAVFRLLESGRCWVKLSGYRSSVAGYPYADVDFLARRLAGLVPERCVWGTDWPHPNMNNHMPDDGELLDLLAAWVPDEERRHRILVDNPAQLYGFDRVGEA